ncbi:MAG: tetratricopeptide repeat protein [Deltaproteobacteria bacterium]|nr:tetratricopeptide repeat protein [Deltaproteobacteria bacterium]
MKQGVDPTAFRLDPTTTRLISLIDGRNTVAEIAGAVGVDLETTLGRLDALASASLLTYVGDSVAPPAGAPRSTVTSASVVGEGPEQPRTTLTPGAPDKAWSAATRGNLSSKPAISVLENVSSTGFTGAIRFERKRVKIECYFTKGQPLGIDSTDPRHDRGTMLRDAGRISDDVFCSYQTALSSGAAHPIAALMQAGLSDRKQLAIHLTWRGSAILKEAATWKDGSYAMAPGMPFPKGLEQLRLLLPRVRRVNWREARLDDEQTKELESKRPKYLVASPNMAQVIAGLRLTDKEAKYVEHVSAKPMQLHQAFAISTLLRSVTKTLLFQLIHSGAFELHDVSPEGITPHELSELETRFRLMEKDNHFNVITAHPVSTEREIKRRYERRLTEFDPSLYPKAEQRHLATLAKIRERLDQAYEVLADKPQRQSYRRQICGSDQLMTFVDLQLRKAEVALKMRLQYDEAIELAVSALDIDGGSAAARLLLAGALAGAGRTREAREQLRGIASVPTTLMKDYETLKRKLG